MLNNPFEKWEVVSGQLAGGSWQEAVGRRQLAVGRMSVIVRAVVKPHLECLGKRMPPANCCQSVLSFLWYKI
jgi:hypothetical protein